MSEKVENKKLEIRRQKVFEYIVIKHPTIEEAEQGNGSEIVVELGRLCADDQGAAFVQASRLIPEEHMKNLARLEVAIRPF